MSMAMCVCTAVSSHMQAHVLATQKCELVCMHLCALSCVCPCVHTTYPYGHVCMYVSCAMSPQPPVFWEVPFCALGEVGVG